MGGIVINYDCGGGGAGDFHQSNKQSMYPLKF